MRLAWIGAAAGLVLSLATTGILSSILVGVATRDPVVLTLVVGLLTLITGAACLVPARAARIDPRISLPVGVGPMPWRASWASIINDLKHGNGRTRPYHTAG
jgi:hypothetical protein